MDTLTIYVHIDASRHLPVEKTIGPIESDSHVDSQGSLEFRDWTTKSPSVGAKERRERLGLFLEVRRRKRGRSWSPCCIDNSSFVACFPSIALFISLIPFLSLFRSLALFFSLRSITSATCLLCLIFLCARDVLSSTYV